MTCSGLLEMMNRPAIVALAGSLLASCQSVPLDLPPDEIVRAEADFVVDAGEIVVVSNSRSDVDSFIQKALQLGYGVERHDSLDELDLQMLVMVLPVGRDGASAIRELESLAPSITAGVNHGYTPQTDDSAPRGRVYAPSLLDWSPQGCPALIPIGVLDSAIDPVRFADARLVSADFSRPGDDEEPPAHATMVADLLLGLGLLSDVRLYHADIVSLDEDLGEAASVDSMLRGLDWLMGNDVRLINISLAGPYNKILDRAFQRAEQEGAIVVAAAGNAGPEAPARYPAGFDRAIAVTAIDLEANVYARAVQGPQIDFSAPGVDVFIAAGGEGRYVSGTSVAAPFVALSIAGDPESAGQRGVGAVRETLAREARDLGAQGPDTVFGWGLIRSPGPCRP